MTTKLVRYQKDVSWEKWEKWIYAPTYFPLSSSSSSSSVLADPFQWDIRRHATRDDYRQMVQSIHDMLHVRQNTTRIYLNELLGVGPPGDWMEHLRVWGDGHLFMCMKPFSEYEGQLEQNAVTKFWNRRLFPSSSSIVLLEQEDAAVLKHKLDEWNQQVEEDIKQTQEQRKEHQQLLRLQQRGRRGQRNYEQEFNEKWIPILFKVHFGLFFLAYISKATDAMSRRG